MFENQFLKTLTPYKVVAPKAWQIEDRSQVLKLDWNEATIPPSPHVFQALSLAIQEESFNWYPNINNVELQESIANYAKVEPSQSMYFASSDAAHENIVKAFCENNDSVLKVGPTYDNFRVVVQSHGGNVSYHMLKESFSLKLEEFSKSLHETRPKLVYICNPNNPTGTEYSAQFLSSLLEEHPNILFLIDEAYYEFTNNTCVPLVSKFRNLIVSRTFSKAFALASFRVGYVLAHESLIQSLSKVRNAKSVSTLSQIAALAALKDVAYTDKYVEEVLVAKQQTVQKLKDLNFEVHHGGGNFILLKPPHSLNELTQYMEENFIFVRSLSHIPDLKEFFRMTIGTQKQMNRVLDVIEGFYSCTKSSTATSVTP